MKFILNILITAVAVYLLAKLLDPHVIIRSGTTAVVFALVLAILNFTVKPLLIILTLPITILTLGLFLLIINTIIVLLAGKFVSGIVIHGFLWAFIFAFLLSVITTILQRLKRRWSLS